MFSVHSDRWCDSVSLNVRNCHHIRWLPTSIYSFTFILILVNLPEVSASDSLWKSLLHSSGYCNLYFRNRMFFKIVFELYFKVWMFFFILPLADSGDEYHLQLYSCFENLLSVLTLSQTTNFRLFQTERVYR